MLVSLVTAMFLHGNLAHLLGNMLFLWVFGNNVEDRLGRRPLPRLLPRRRRRGDAGVRRAEPRATTPLVGASGAIAAILGAYLLLYPRAQVLTYVPFPLYLLAFVLPGARIRAWFLIFAIVTLPAWLVLGGWFALQAVAARSSLSSGVAYEAHVAGFLAGIVLLLLLDRRRRAARPGAVPPPAASLASRRHPRRTPWPAPPPAEPPVFGWREHVALPEWGIGRLRAKLDTGARTSALHVEDLVELGPARRITRTRSELVRFHVLTGPRAAPQRVEVTAPIVGHTVIRDTRARPERRPIVRTRIVCGPLDRDIEISLTDRTGMNFRLLLGRLALDGAALVDPSHGFRVSRPAADPAAPGPRTGE